MPAESTAACPACGSTESRELVAGFCPGCLARMAFGSSRLAPQAVTASSLSAALPQDWGHYTLTHWIGLGPLGSVFRATHRPTGVPVAIRLLERGPLANTAFVDRWRAESGRLPIGLAGIARARDASFHGSLRYLVTDWVEGESWDRQEAALPPVAAVQWLRAAARRLGPLHAAGLLHANLKPTNVIRTAPDEVCLLDPGFGRHHSIDSEQTLHGQAHSDPTYTAPEQLGGLPEDITTAADIYSLGALLFRLLTGRAPFAGSSHAGIAREVRQAAGPPWTPADMGIPAPHREVVADLMRRSPTARPPGVDAVLAMLARL